MRPLQSLGFSVLSLLWKRSIQNETCDAGSGKVESLTTCTLILAQSTIPNAGLGVFTAIDRKPGDLIGNGDVALPIVDLWYHFSAIHGDIKEDNTEVAHLEPLRHYIWAAPSMGMQDETAFEPATHASALAVGLDAAINCNPALVNVEKTEPFYDSASLHRSVDPGSGAFTPYSRVDSYATHQIPEGGELFKYYGDDWFTTRMDTVGAVSLMNDYIAAEELIHHFHKLFDKKKTVVTEAATDLWQLVVNFPYASRTLLALPHDPSELKFAQEEGIRALFQPDATRTLESLQATGRCADNIMPGYSSILQAGHGAFATRFIENGSVVTGSPLLVIQGDYYFKMYDGDWFTKEQPPNVQKVVRHQILLNYCFNHPSASVYLCPYGMGVNYINHNKTLANVRLVWPKDGELGHNASLLKNSHALLYNGSPGLVLDYVATRDIQPEEELFLDYGDEWESAWDHHVSTWGTTSKHSTCYESAREWNVENPHEVLRTYTEQLLDPYPSHFEMRCHPSLTFDGYYETVKGIVRDIPCHIIERVDSVDGEIIYKVWYKRVSVTGNESDEWEESQYIYRHYISFRDRPYSTDLFLVNAFRQPLGLPDELFPDAWRGINWEP